jgi:hypothetical protein
MFYFVILVVFHIILVKVYDSLTPRDVRIASFMGRREYFTSASPALLLLYIFITVYPIIIYLFVTSHYHLQLKTYILLL